MGRETSIKTEGKHPSGEKGSSDRRAKEGVSIAATLSMRRADQAFYGGDRIRLLEAIDRFGSITRAAREVGISYKTAWDAVDAMNNAAEKPLVRRSAGGVGGGGTLLTEEGRETVRLYRVLQEEHQKFIRRLEGRLGDVPRFYSLVRRVAMRVSARNVFLGRVAAVRKGAVSTEVTLTLKGGEILCSVITNESAGVLGLKAGVEIYAFFKASSVILGKDLHAAKVSARNLLCGTADRILHGPVNAEVTVALPGGSVLTAIVTEESAKRLSLYKGDHVCALVKASSVILGVDA
ncbi:MAG: LysR family transcriptional regulator [Deltaproteobacteria bacterium]|nr:LysR family transcriptional regulator [Deltaproteobacteria bacterium]